MAASLVDIATGKAPREFAELPDWMKVDIRSQDGKLRAEFDARRLRQMRFSAAELEVDIHLVDSVSGARRRLLKGLRARLDTTRFTLDGRIAVPGALNAVFSPDGCMVAAGGVDGTVRLWEVATGQERLRMAGHQGQVFAVAFSPDGRQLASAAADGTVLIWDVTGLTPTQRRAAAAQADPSKLWEDLASADAVRAYRALVALSGDTDKTLAVLKERLTPAVTADAKRLARLVDELDDGQFTVRRRATENLEQLAELAEPALRRALAGQPPLEVRQRLERLLELLQAPLVHAERLQALRAVEVLERIGSPAAREQLRLLASGAPESWVTQAARAAEKRLSAGGLD